MVDQHRVPPPELGWTLPQRRALLTVLGVFLIVLCLRFVTDRQYVSDPQPPHGARYNELASRVDPNTADWQTLAAIPTLGEKRARDIVAYRDRVRGTDPNAIVFKSAADLRSE